MPDYGFIAEGYLSYSSADEDFFPPDVPSGGMGFFGEAAVS